MQIAIIADSHYDRGSRWEECVRLHDWIAADMRARGVDLVLHAGDVYERKSTPEERTAVAAWLRSVADFAPVVLVRGNHDAVGDLAIFGRLKTRHPVIVEEAAGVHVVAGAAVGAVAWPRKSTLLAAMGRPVGQEESGAVAADMLRNVMLGLGSQLADHDGPRVLLSHAMVRGSMTSHGQPLVGADMELGLEDLGLARARFVALGHIHLGQEWEIGGAPVVYPGSPRRTSYGELEAKGYVLTEWDGGRLVSWERVETPATRMILLEGQWADGQLLGIEHPPLSGAEVRLRYTVPADHREAARAEAAAWRKRIEEAGAVDVKVEEVVQATTRARAPEVATARTLPEKLQALWSARGEEIPTDRADRLFGRVAQLEEEVSHA